MRASWAQLEATPVAELVDGDSLADLLEQTFSRASIEQTLSPAVHAALSLELGRLRGDSRTLGEFVPGPARAELETLLAHPQLLPERLVRMVLEHPQVQGALQEILQEALEEFSEKVNPITAEWGLPAALRKLSPFGLGLGGLGKSLDGLNTELQRRIQPEIKRFLQGFSRRALAKIASLVLNTQDNPSTIRIRREILGSLLAEPIASLTPLAEDERLQSVRSIAIQIAAHTAQQVREEHRRLLLAELEALAPLPLSEALEARGIRLQPDLDAFARASWPLVRGLLSGEALGDWLLRLMEDQEP